MPLILTTSEVADEIYSAISIRPGSDGQCTVFPYSHFNDSTSDCVHDPQPNHLHGPDARLALFILFCSCVVTDRSTLLRIRLHPALPSPPPTHALCLLRPTKILFRPSANGSLPLPFTRLAGVPAVVDLGTAGTEWGVGTTRLGRD